MLIALFLLRYFVGHRFDRVPASDLILTETGRLAGGQLGARAVSGFASTASGLGSGRFPKVTSMVAQPSFGL